MDYTLKTPCYQIFFDSKSPNFDKLIDLISDFGDVYLTADSDLYLWMTRLDEKKFKSRLKKIDDELYFRRINVTQEYIDANHNSASQWMLEKYEQYVQKLVEENQELLRKIVSNIDRLSSTE